MTELCADVNWLIVAQPPTHLLVQVLSLEREIVSIENPGAGGQGRAAKHVTRTVWIEEPAAVIVAEHWKATRWSHQGGEVIGHATDDSQRDRTAKDVVAEHAVECVDMVVLRP